MIKLPNIKIGDKALITTDNWFIAPDGGSYRAVFGTVHAVHTDKDTLGITTNERSTNWYVQIGNMLVAGCQIHYAIKTDIVNDGDAEDWHSNVEYGCKRYSHPCAICMADN